MVRKGVSARNFLRSYEEYSSVLNALGYSLSEDRVLSRAAGGKAAHSGLKVILADYRRGQLNGERVRSEVWERMERLRKNLIENLQPEAHRLAGAGSRVPTTVRGAALARLVKALPQEHRDCLADLVLLGGHRDMVEARKMSVEEFQHLLREFAGTQTVARKKLVAHLRRELLRRGINMSHETIEERFRSHPSVRTMPCCVRWIFRGLGNEFRTGLILIEEMVGKEDPDQWLRRVQRFLKFRSQSAMHKAIAGAGRLSYDCIHKALAGKRKAKRIQVDIKRCLDEWVARAQCGQEIGVAEDQLGVPVEEVGTLMPSLRQRFRTKEAIYRAISERTGIRTGSIRRYFQNDGQLKFAPLPVYRVARQLSESPIPAPVEEPPAARPRASRSASPCAADPAERMARMASRALTKWRENRADRDLEMKFKELRRRLIMELSARHRRNGAASIPMALGQPGVPLAAGASY